MIILPEKEGKLLMFSAQKIHRAEDIFHLEVFKIWDNGPDNRGSFYQMNPLFIFFCLIPSYKPLSFHCKQCNICGSISGEKEKLSSLMSESWHFFNVSRLVG